MLTHAMESIIRRAVEDGTMIETQAASTAMSIMLSEIDRLRATIVRLRDEAADGRQVAR